MNALRKELKALLEARTVRRPPALRRSLREDSLYAADLPAAAEPEETERFIREAETAGWTVRPERGWIELDRPVSGWPEGSYDGPFGSEAACCLSLLRRHAPGPEEKTDGPETRRAARLLLHAGEKGPEAYERACRQLHTEWAARLREKDPLPRLDERYFGG